MRTIHILWDASHIWGLMAWRALRAMGFCCRLTKGKEIAEGVLLGKSTRGGRRKSCPLLIVPGGNARFKATALGGAGREAIRAYLDWGGHYLGFCGGAGLALSHQDAEEGLNICPWQRAGYSQRLHHLISGHVLAESRAVDALSPPKNSDGTLSLPVWWPGRFAPDASGAVRVLATCARPAADFWLADLPLQSIPRHIFPTWQASYGINLSADFLAGQPLVIAGEYGTRGSYLLSYSHLETPQSSDANAWLACLLCSLTGLPAQCDSVPVWDFDRIRPTWDDGSALPPLLDALRGIRALLDLACEHHLLFRRTPWLWGWRAGLPGAALNYLHAALCTMMDITPSAEALAYWRENKTRFTSAIALFLEGAEGYLLACRLAETLASSLPAVVEKQTLQRQREAVFGHAMIGGGLVGTLLGIVEEMIYLSQDAGNDGVHGAYAARA